MWWLQLMFLAPALGIHMDEPPPPIPAANNAEIQELWLNVRLNHFDASNTDTFPMRFFYNRVSQSPNTIVIFIGGQWPITSGWVAGGLARDLAAFSGGSLFYTEHRYYGLTRPSNDISTPSLQYLTVDQALADLSQFISYVKSEQFQGGRYRDAKVALVGCSYAGTMATWMRLTYPHLVDAAFSDSGPLYAKEEFSDYLEVVGDALRLQGGDSCYDSVQQAVERITQIFVQEPNSLSILAQLFNTCAPLTPWPNDIATLHWAGVVRPLANLVESAAPGDIAAACQHITDPAKGDPLERLVSWVNSQPGPACLESRFTEVVNSYTNSSYDSPTAAMRVWFYQTCTEFGWYQTTAGQRQPFGGVPLAYFYQMCANFFMRTPTELQLGINRTNLFFGGRHIPDKVVTAQGLLDPWHPVGPNQNLSSSLTPVYVLPEVSHCRLIYPIEQSETEAVREVKIKVINDLEVFMHGALPSAAWTFRAGALVIAAVLMALM